MSGGSRKCLMLCEEQIKIGVMRSLRGEIIGMRVYIPRSVQLMSSFEISKSKLWWLISRLRSLCLYESSRSSKELSLYSLFGR